MASCCNSFRVFLPFKNDVRLGQKRIRHLGPEKRYRSSDLYEGRNHRHFTTEASLGSEHNLFNFYKICRAAFLVDTASQIPCTREMPASPGYQHKGKFFSAIYKIFEVDMPMHHRENPLFSHQNVVHFLDQKIIPHHRRLPRFMLLQLPSSLLVIHEEIFAINIREVRQGFVL